MDKNSVKPLEELLDSVRDIDGFPIAEDEDILALSDPPFYTACPNPYINKFIEEYGSEYCSDADNYDKKPFVGKVSEGKNDEIYRAHTYHTKVPYKAIIEFILHYTEPGDIVFDGFCGSGMTGVAAGFSQRKAILSDLSPAATFISYNYNFPTDPDEYLIKTNKILSEIEEECGWMFQTKHTKNAISIKNNEKPVLLANSDVYGLINYTIWSDVFCCPYCNNEYDFWNATITKGWKVQKKFKCPNCDANITKQGSNPTIERKFDPSLNKEVEFRKQVPVMIIYSVGKERYRKEPDEFDFDLIRKIGEMEIPYWYPTNELPIGYNTEQPKKSHGLTHVHHFYTRRNLWVLSAFANKLGSTREFINITSVATIMTKLYRFRSQKGTLGAGGGPMNGTLYVPSLIKEIPIIKVLKEHISKTIKLKKFISSIGPPIIQTASNTDLKQIKSNSVDYIFTDPPFGDNIMYSELNFIWESWLKVFTNNQAEAIVNKPQNKNLDDYTNLMSKSFEEMYRILKPKRWITIVFHNSKASVWNAIQESITRAGFMVAQVSTLDKKQGSFKQVTSAGSVKNDLIINAYKPKEEFSKRFINNAGEGMEIEFVKEQLVHLPIEPNIGRTEQMLYSKTLAHYVENGFKIRYNSTNFYKILSDNFVDLDGYWFLENQIKVYNKWKSGLSLDQLKEVLDGQQVLFVLDEKTAVTWIYNYLHKPRDYGEIYTSYQQVTTKTTDKIPELKKILNDNFIIEKGKYRRPLNDKEREEINKNRDKELDSAFNNLLEQARTQKGKIKEVRCEALVHGFTKCYQEEKYQDILTIADKLYTGTLESSGDIMDFVDIARIRTSGKEEL